MEAALPPALQLVEPPAEERHTTCLPLVPLQAAAGAFSDIQRIEDDGFDWVTVEAVHRLQRGMFVPQVIGKSMELAIPDGVYCLFRASVGSTYQGKTVLVQMRDYTTIPTPRAANATRSNTTKARKRPMEMRGATRALA